MEAVHSSEVSKSVTRVPVGPAPGCYHLASLGPSIRRAGRLVDVLTQAALTITHAELCIYSSLFALKTHKYALNTANTFPGYSIMVALKPAPTAARFDGAPDAEVRAACRVQFACLCYERTTGLK